MPPEPLCSYCAQISFDIPILTAGREGGGYSNGYLRWDLGSGERVYSSPCPFCRLVSHAIYEEKRSRATSSYNDWPEGHKNVIIYWRAMSDWDLDKPWWGGAFFAAGCRSRISFGAPEAPDGLDESKDKTTSGAEYLLRSTPATLDVELVRRWIARCKPPQTDQPPRPIGNIFPGLKVFRFIDVEENRLYETYEIPQYVALSYVWGSVPNFGLTKANREVLLRPGGLLKAWKLVPTTVTDAILLCRKLRVCYLWVDALCLVQDDENDLELGVNVMDEVYEQSWLTVVAACGHNANAGLPGVRQGTRVETQNTVEVIPGVFLGLVMDLEQLIGTSVYSTRAWTFQESLLAQRAVYFIDNKVFFRCREVQFSEDCIGHQYDPSRPSRRGVGVIEPGVDLREMAILTSFSSILSQYSGRALTQAGDAQRAVAGIIRRFSTNLGYEFFEGLPSAAIDAFIIFVPVDGSLRRRQEFPSYSWTGWSGETTCRHVEDWDSEQSYKYVKWLTQNTWIIWYKRRLGIDCSLHVVWDPDQHQELLRTTRWNGTGLLWAAFIDEAGKEDREQCYDGYLERKIFRPPMPLPLPTGSLRTDATLDVKLTVPDDNSQISYQLLQFWTLSVYFRLGAIDVLKATATVLGKDNILCGAIYLDHFEDSAFFDTSRSYQIILLSESRQPLCQRDGIERRLAQGWKYKEHEYYNVMLLEQKGSFADGQGTFAARRGIGSIYKTALSQSLSPGPAWKEILLA